MNDRRVASSLIASALCMSAFVAGCKERDNEVIVYCSVDEIFAKDIFKSFEKKTGITVRPVFDSEAGKTTGLINRLRAEQDRPRADVLFSSELFNTMQLADAGFFESYDSPAAADLPPAYRDRGRRWNAIGLRGRVLAFDPRRASRQPLPERWEQLAEPQFAARLAFANPMFGTTRGHVAAMFALWGSERATAFLTQLKERGALVVDGNSAAVRAVIDGRSDYCMTDTDDVLVAQADGAVLDFSLLDMGDGGTLWIPSTVAIIKGARHQRQAQQLADCLASADVERMLAQSESRNVPVRPSLRAELHLPDPVASRISYEAIAARIDASAEAVRDILIR